MFPKDTEQQLFHYICEALSAVVHEKRITALLLSTIFAIFQHQPFYSKRKPLVCTSRFLRVCIIFLNSKGNCLGLHCRSPPSDFDFASQLKIEIGGLPMKKINLRDYYPFYTKDTVVEVPEEIAFLLREYELLEEAYRIRTYRYKAFYSLDYAGGIERDMAALEQKNPCDLVEQLYDREQLYKALASLPEKQRNRIYAHYFLGMSKSAIARAEGINESNVRKSIEHGLSNLQKILEEIF